MKAFLIPISILIIFSSCNTPEPNSLPEVWMSYKKVNGAHADFIDMKDKGVELVELFHERTIAPDSALAAARATGLKLGIRLGNHILPDAHMVSERGIDPEYALMIGGVYQGKAIDRHLFKFSAAKQSIIIEPPVYNQNFPYKNRETGKKLGHYFPNVGVPVKAEIIVPVKKFDGEQHIKIIEASVKEITNIQLHEDSTPKDSSQHPEIKNRKLYQLSFDLSELSNAMLDKIGIAVYWPFYGSDIWFIFEGSPVSAAASTTHKALRLQVKKTVDEWTQANGGLFPKDIIKIMRVGDECFNLSGHVNPQTPSVSLPLWDYSSSAIKAYQTLTTYDYPRTWGYPEIYGEQAYANWMYNLHKNNASIIRTVKDELLKHAPHIQLYRNTTRAEVFSILNDHDGSGSELLTRELDIVHLDPYPAMANYYTDQIPMDMAYYAGLSRRYNKPLIPWMQAHLYGTAMSKHITPEIMDKMMNQQLHHGIDGFVWLGFGYEKGMSFPNRSKQSWEYAKTLHAQAKEALHQKPVAKLAALRFYDKWALTSFRDSMITNSNDWLLTQFLINWSVKYEQHYDVYEIAPNATKEFLNELKSTLEKYEHIVSNREFEGAENIGSWYKKNNVYISEKDQIIELIDQKMIELDYLQTP